MIVLIEIIVFLALISLSFLVYRGLVHSAWFAGFVASFGSPPEDVVGQLDRAEQDAEEAYQEARRKHAEARERADQIRERLSQ